jgi:hypothetical protein
MTKTTATISLALVTVALVAAFAQPAFARQPATVAGGYSFLRELGTAATPATNYPNGWFAAVTVPLGRLPLAVSGEINVNSRTNIIETQRLQAFLGGVHVPFMSAGKLLAFGRALVGVERFSEPGFSESGFAFQPGAGIDLGVTRTLGARVEVDYRIVSQEQVTFKEVRVITGVVIRLGGS